MKKEQTNKAEKDSRQNRRIGGLQLGVLKAILLKSHRATNQRVYARTVLKKSGAENLLFGNLSVRPPFQKTAKKQESRTKTYAG